jgi:hypothetical protein
MLGELDIIHVTVITFRNNPLVLSQNHNRWVLDSVLSQLINQIIDGFDITSTKMNRAFCGKMFEVITDDRRFSRKYYYFFSTNKEDPPTSNKDWAISPSVVTVVAPLSVALKTHLYNIMQAQSDNSSFKALRNNMITIGET